MCATKTSLPLLPLSNLLPGILSVGLSMTTFVSAFAADSTVTQWPLADGGNGHFYEFVATKTNWNSAQSDAQSRSLFGVSGHLATISNLAENEFVRSLITDDSELFWLGLVDVSPNREFTWVDEPGVVVWEGGTPAQGGSSPLGLFTNWETNEPNNAGGNENFTIMYTENGRWNDTLLNRLGDGASYVIEYNVIPEPNSQLLAFCGTAVLAVRRRRKCGSRKVSGTKVPFGS